MLPAQMQVSGIEVLVCRQALQAVDQTLQFCLKLFQMAHDTPVFTAYMHPYFSEKADESL